MSKHPLVIVAAIFVAIVALYYLMSPYQICMRSEIDMLSDYCTRNTSW